LLTQMRVFQHTGRRHRSLILHQQALLCSTYQQQEICSLIRKTYKTLKIIELIGLIA